MIRPGKFGDIPAVANILRQSYERSRYRNVSGFNEKAAKAYAMQAVQRHGNLGAGGQCLFVAEQGGEVRGFIIGILQPLYLLGTKLEAQDVFFIVTPGSHPSLADGLLDSYEAWATANPNVVEVVLSATNIISSPERTARLFERKGFSRKGVICGKVTT